MEKIQRRILFVLIGLLCVVWFFEPLGLGHWGFCLHEYLMGFPCPGCGATRATSAFLRGDWQAAWAYNWAIFPVFLYVTLWASRRIWSGIPAYWERYSKWIMWAALLGIYLARLFEHLR